MADLTTNVATGQAGHPALHNEERTLLNSHSAAIAALQSGGGGGGGAVGEVLIDSLTTSTSDDDMLAAAVAHHQTQTYSPIYRMGLRKYTFTQTWRPPHGFSLKGSGWKQLAVVSASHPSAHTTVKLAIPLPAGATTASWVDASAGTVWDFNIGNFNGYSDTTYAQAFRAPYVDGTHEGFRECGFYNMVWQNMYSVFGNKAEGCAMTICDVSGPGWQIAECRDQGVTIQGSDCGWIFGDGCDWYNVGSVAQGGEKWMGEFRSLGKSNIGPIYITAYGGWRGLKITGGVSTGGTILSPGSKIEGNNADQPCDGALLRIEGGSVGIRDITIDDGMANPSLTTNVSSNGATPDRGLIEILGTAKVYMDGVHVAHANNVAVSTPVAYVAGSAEVRLRNFTRFQRGVAWGTQLPVVKQATTGLVKDYDTSVAVSVG